ncbi:MAG: hypothetical protein V4449_03965 [Patescibacteria group bacterium]
MVVQHETKRLSAAFLEDDIRKALLLDLDNLLTDLKVATATEDHESIVLIRGGIRGVCHALGLGQII